MHQQSALDELERPSADAHAFALGCKGVEAKWIHLHAALNSLQWRHSSDLSTITGTHPQTLNIPPEEQMLAVFHWSHLVHHRGAMPAMVT